MAEAPFFLRPDGAGLSEGSIDLWVTQRDSVEAGPSPAVGGDEVRRAAARLVVFGFHGKAINSHAKKLISLGAGGVILFSRNVEDPEQVARLCADLKREAGGRPLLIMVDQEGGKVSRLGPPFTAVPSAHVIGATNESSAAEAAGTIIGRELRAVHIDVDLAPVVDVDTNPDNPVIGRRSFGSDPRQVGEMGYAFVRGVQKEGVAACVKHFPGHGDTSVDSHLELPSLARHDLARLEAVELRPFRKMVDADVAAVMAAHVAVPALASCPEDVGRPATLSKGALDYLRRTMRFDGVIATDCLEMGAIVKHYSVAEAAVLSLLAGTDCLLICHTQERQESAIDAIVQAVASGRLPLSRVKAAGARLGELIRVYYRPPGPAMDADLFQASRLGFVGCKEHRDVVANIVHQAAAETARMVSTVPTPVLK